MTLFWQVVFVCAVVFLAVRREMRRRAAAAGSQPDEPWHRPDPEDDPRVRDIRERLAKGPLESDWLQPEPPPIRGFGRRGDGAERKDGAGDRFASSRVAEEVTAILRKQVPPRDEPPRSWLGGLPMLPDAVEWPRGVNPEKPDEGEVPLHFIAQIACADLPVTLWGGLGPRTGWLLLFVNGNTCEHDDRGVWRLLHTDALGAERAPPADIGPIHDGMYTGFTAYTLRESVYPRWPVDIVEMPNTLRIESGRSLAAPANLAQTLYPEAEIAEEHHARLELEPFTWACLAEALESVVRSLTEADGKAKGYRARMHERLHEPGMIARIVPALEEREVQFRSDYGAMLAEPEEALNETERARRARMRMRAAERQAHIADVTALLEAHPTPDALIARIEREDENGWKAAASDYLSELAAFARKQGANAALSPEHWAKVRAELGTLDKDIWALAWSDGEGSTAVSLEKRTLSVLHYLATPLAAASTIEAVACFTDPARRSLIPAGGRAQLERLARRLHDNRPHRMGGYHDGVQTDAQPGPTDRLLVMQFAVDDVLQWVWGDCGAVYCYMTPGDLTAQRFDRAEFHLECY